MSKQKSYKTPKTNVFYVTLYVGKDSEIVISQRYYIWQTPTELTPQTDYVCVCDFISTAQDK